MCRAGFRRGRERTAAGVAGSAPSHGSTNQGDAIAVSINGWTVGYLSRTDAVAYQTVMRAAGERGAVAVCGATINGGWKRSKGDEGHFGVVLDLARPERALP